MVMCVWQLKDEVVGVFEGDIDGVDVLVDFHFDQVGLVGIGFNFAEGNAEIAGSSGLC